LRQKKDQLLTLKEAADYMGKSVHNVSYLITYGRIRKLNKAGKQVKYVGKGDNVHVSKSELEEYIQDWKDQLEKRRKSLGRIDKELAFFDVSEKERTKHVHRLHPYIGKFIPQLVEYYVKRNFSAGDCLLDPFAGSSTTGVVCGESGLKYVGIEISEFNCIISETKLTDYSLEKVKKEINDIYKLTKEFSENWTRKSLIKDSSIKQNKYLNDWFAKRSLAELTFYKNQIKNFDYQDVLKIILTRAARSSRLVHHYDIATPKKPLKEGTTYTCKKHLNRKCKVIDRAIGKLGVYSNDTQRRLEEYSGLRKSTDYLVLHDDSRTIDLKKEIKKRWGNVPINGIFTSPPYVGQIDYHENHRYAYELFGIPRRDEKEIGRKKLGKSKKAQEKYQENISAVFRNVSKALSPDAKIFIVANDKFKLYDKIIKDAGLKKTGFKERPVEARAEGDKTPYSEKIFECVLA